MDQDITSWKNLWDEKKSNSIDLDILIPKINQIEKKNKKESIFLLIVFPLTILILAFLLPVVKSVYYLLAICSIAAGMLLILIQLYRGKIRQGAKEDISSNQDFMKATIKSLHKKRLMTSRYMRIYTVLFLSGINLGYIEIIGSLNVVSRILMHSAISVAILLFMYFSIRKRINKNNQKMSHLIDELNSLLK